MRIRAIAGAVIGTERPLVLVASPGGRREPSVGALGRAPSPGTIAPFPQDLWIYFLADYRKVVVMVLLAKLIA